MPLEEKLKIDRLKNILSIVHIKLPYRQFLFYLLLFYIARIQHVVFTHIIGDMDKYWNLTTSAIVCHIFVSSGQTHEYSGGKDEG